MQELAQALGDTAIRDWYLAFCFALLVLPILVASIWYHRRIGRSAGGRALMKRQRGASRNLSEGMAMMRDIKSGRYGKTAKTMQNRLYVIVACWIVANIIAFGILAWADEVNRAAG